MLRSLKELESYKVSAIDGEVGKVTDFLFDDLQWTTRYLITDTSGFWESANKVLVSPISFHKVDGTAQLIHVELTQDKVRNSPSVDLDKPVSRQYEQDFADYYGWPAYWGLGGIWGMGGFPTALSGKVLKEQRKVALAAHKEDDAHLRSAKEVVGYHLQVSDGEIGHVTDFIVDDETWTIRYLVVDTSNWWLGKKVLLAPHWAQKISWSERLVYVSLTKDDIKNSPEWDHEALLNRDYEERLHRHYGQTGYWLRRDGK